MVAGCNADPKWGEKKMELDDSVKTMDCLRGRLLAERMVSRNAKAEAELLEKKLIELENLLKNEAKSRKRAERKLKFLTKKLEFMNIPYVSDENSQELAVIMDKSDISSVSCTPSTSRTKDTENHQSEISTLSEVQESDKEVEASESSDYLHLTEPLLDFSPGDSTYGWSSSSDISMFSAISESFDQNVVKNTTDKDSSERANHIKSDQFSSYLRTDDQSVEFSNEGSVNQDCSQEPQDNSKALVLIEMPDKMNERIDPEVLDASVKEVLDSLRAAKEQIQRSIDRKQVINFILVG